MKTSAKWNPGRAAWALGLGLASAACPGIEAIEAPPPLTGAALARAELGQALFFDARLSLEQDAPCSSCHRPDHGGAEPEPTSRGTGGALGRRNAPSAWAASLKTLQFWDGRADSLEAQALGPLFNPTEMGLDAETLVRRLAADPNYPRRFEAAFPGEADPIRPDNVVLALASYQRRLAWPGRVDRFLQGDESALNAEERAGYDDFIANCAFCHGGPGVGGDRFERLGDREPWPSERATDLGRMEVTGNRDDRLVFVVPSLRHVGTTAPYFHDGSVETLEEAIRLMAWHQLGERYDDERIAKIAAFLRALDGTPPPELLRPPERGVR